MIEMQPLEIPEFDPQTAGDAEFASLNRFMNQMTAELRPEYPATTIEETRREWTFPPPNLHMKLWTVQSTEGEVIAAAGFYATTKAENRHIANAWISVLPEVRLRGIGSRLLRPISDEARAQNRTVIHAWTSSTSPGGEHFMKRLGGEAALPMKHSQLLISELNLPVIQDWLDRARALENEFELGDLEGRYPDDVVDDFVHLHEVITNTLPRGSLDYEETHNSVEDERHWEEDLAAEARERWSVFVRKRSTGELCGLTEVFYSSAHPTEMGQGYTGVLPAYRNRGLGRWLKAAMIEKVVRERPTVERMSTGNAEENAAMLKINVEMGYKLFRTSENWQISVDKVEAYLKENGVF